MSQHTPEFDHIAVGDKIRFDPPAKGRRWWTVRARDKRFIVVTTQAPFEPKGSLWYSVVDLTGWQDKRYNGAGNGVVRSSLNTLGGGWDCETDEGVAAILPALQTGEWELSHRRVLNVIDIERSDDPATHHRPPPPRKPAPLPNPTIPSR